MYLSKYRTPEGFSDLLMSSDGIALTGLWFEGSGDECKQCGRMEEKELPVFLETAAWLDAYFSGCPSEKLPAVKIEGMTAFRKEVLSALMEIPFGKTVTYGEIGGKLAEKRGLSRMSAQAVGQAVGWNPVCILIPCHRVIGSNGSLTGYGGGIENKKQLLLHERRLVK